MKCKNCMHCVVTRQKHNGDKKEIREHLYCSVIDISDYEIDNMFECEMYEEEMKNGSNKNNKRN